jgi:hypothetical protein
MSWIKKFLSKMNHKQIRFLEWIIVVMKKVLFLLLHCGNTI